MNDQTAEFYRKHHEAGGRYGFTIAAEVRGGWFREEVANASKALGKPVLDVLDIGCRDGTLTAHYSQGHRVTGLDIDTEAVRRARASGLDARVHDLNAAPLPFPSSSFDLVIAGEVLEHLQWPQAVVEDIHRVLRPGGRFIGTVPNAFRLRNRILFLLGRDFELDPTHLRSFSPRSLKQMLAPFPKVTLEFHGGRRRDLHPELMAANMHWVASR